MKKIIILFYLLFLVIALVFPSQSEIKTTINFVDKQIYYPDSKIKIKISIINQSSEIFSFNSFEVHSFNFRLRVKTLKNIALNYSENYIIQHNKNKPVFYREITLLPGEEYSFITSLSDYVAVREPGIYIIEGDFFPNYLGNNTPAPYKSNVLTLYIRPSTSSSKLQDKIDTETKVILRKTALPPDEVVSYILTARQHGDWNKFFLYLDLESLLLNEPRMGNKYEHSDEKERMKMLRDYRSNLQNEIVNDDILLIPSNFQILNTSYTPEKGKVIARETFKYRGYEEIKEYTYFLHKIEGIWTVYNYEIRNLGTE